MSLCCAKTWNLSLCKHPFRGNKTLCVGAQTQHLAHRDFMPCFYSNSNAVLAIRSLSISLRRSVCLPGWVDDGWIMPPKWGGTSSNACPSQPRSSCALPRALTPRLLLSRDHLVELDILDVFMIRERLDRALGELDAACPVLSASRSLPSRLLCVVVTGCG